MATYNIPVENIEKLRKKVAQIQRKAEKYNCTITFEEVGEYFEKYTLRDGTNITRKYIVVEAEGEAKINGWIFAGTIEHTQHGNILRSVSDEHKIPERYRDAAPYCEHCHTKRFRKDTYVVFNEETGEFKQVGKSCLMNYTNGMSVEHAALILRCLKSVEDYCYVGSGCSYEHYFNVREMSRYYVETMRKFGWASSSAEYSTKSLANDFYTADHPRVFTPKEFIRKMKEKAAQVNFDPAHTTDEYLDAALEWARSWDGHEYNDYRDNLKVIAQMEYCKYKHLGYLASLYMAYDREMEREIKKMERQKIRAKSAHIGQVGDKISEEVKNWKCLTAWETQWGTIFMYEFTTEDGNIMIWKTSKWLDEDDEITSIAGKVKAHTEFRGVQQTELTRCKVA